MRMTDTGDLWWKNALVYCLDVQTFFDADGDGVGDFQGLAQRIDYLADLGVTCLWLMPFYPTADLDDGYDITDFYGVDSRLGSLGDFVEVVRTARDRGMKVIADLVVNHTSAQHPWFVSARSSPESPYRDWYVWQDEKPDDVGAPVFPGEETSTWSYDRKAKAWYLHHFRGHQPDLNVANPKVRDEIAKIMGFWTELGLSGFRVDAVPFLLETQGIERGMEMLPDPHDYLRDLRAFLGRRQGGAVLLGEVNLEYEDARRFFGDEDGDELTMVFDFPLMQAVYLALARADAGSLRTALMHRPPAPSDGQWAVFLRNHDELTLDKLSGAERAEVFARFGPEQEMQLYGRGLRRRLPPMVGGDQRVLRMLYSLMFSLPGTPVLFYGEEIGMGENLAIDGRLAVRTPMQWDSGENAGFSTTSDPRRLPRPLVEGDFSTGRGVNVSDERRNPDSLLCWMRALIRRYRECPELAWGTSAVIDHDRSAVLVRRCDWEDGTILVAHNLADHAEKVSLVLDSPAEDCRLVDLDDTAVEQPLGPEGRVSVDLEAYGHRWLRLLRPGDRHLL